MRPPRRRPVFAAFVLIALSSGCSRGPTGPSTEPSNAPPKAAAGPTAAPAPNPPASAASAPPRPALPEGTLVVGGPDGIVELGLDGSVKRILTKTPASAPRFAPGGRDVLFLARDKHELRVVSRDGRERVVATLPMRKECVSPEKTLSPHEESDFIVDPKKGVACLRLADRNANMMSIGVVARVELATGKAKTAVSLSLSEPCRAEKIAESLLDCEYGGEVNQNGKPAKTEGSRLPAGYHEESRSPSERWAVVTGNVQEGDYIHRDLYLFDTSAGRIYPVVKGNWPAPIPAEMLGKGGPDATADAVGESTIRWLGVADWLLVDNLLIAPGERVSELPGDLAR